MQHLEAINYAFEKLENDLSDKLKYHSPNHTQSVFRFCEHFVKGHNLKEEDLNLLYTAAAYHDIGFTQVYKEHELEGCKMAEEILPRFNFSPEQIERVKSMILATKIPQTPHNLLEEILCDADLAYLGGENYHEIAECLHKELDLHGSKLSQKDWLKLQISFLDQHHFWTTLAQVELDVKKELVLNELKEELKTQKESKN